jgi:hypothetical protein
VIEPVQLARIATLDNHVSGARVEVRVHGLVAVWARQSLA